MYLYFKKCFLLDYSWLQFDSVLFPANSEQIGRGNTSSGYQWRDCLIQSHADLYNNYVKIMGIQLQQLYQLSMNFRTRYKGKNIFFLKLLMTYFSTVHGYPPLTCQTELPNTGVWRQSLFKRLSELLAFQNPQHFKLIVVGRWLIRDKRQNTLNRS